MAQRAQDSGTGSIGVLIDALHQDLGVSRADVLASLCLEEKDLARSHTARTSPTAPTMRRLQTLMALRDGLQEMFAGTEGVHEWMHAELRDLHWKTPQQALRNGDLDGVYAAFEGLASGIFL